MVVAYDRIMAVLLRSKQEARQCNHLQRTHRAVTDCVAVAFAGMTPVAAVALAAAVILASPAAVAAVAALTVRCE